MLKAITARLPWGQQQKQISRVEALVLDMMDSRSNGFFTYTGIVKEAYKRNSVVGRAIRLIATNAGSVKPLLYSRGREQDKEVREHPVLDLLRRPNRHTAGRRFFETIIIHKFLSGNAYILKLPLGPGPARELHLLRPDLVEVVPGPSLGSPRTFKYRPTPGKVEIYREEDLLWLHSIDPLNQNAGLSDLASVLQDIDASNLASSWNISLLRNGGKPSAVVIAKTWLSDEQRQLLQEAKQSQFGGYANAGKIAVIEGQDVEWQEIGMSATDMDWLQGRKHVEAKIAVGIGVPPELVGLSEHKTFSNYEQAQKALWTETIVPELDYIYTELDNWLVPLYGSEGSLYLAPFLDEVAILQDDKGEEAKRIGLLVKHNVVTFGQAGEDLGYEVREDMRERYFWEVEHAKETSIFPENPDDPTTMRQQTPREGQTSGSRSSGSDDDEEADRGKGIKRFNLQNEQQQEMFWKRVEEQRLVFEDVITERFERHFSEEKDRVVKAAEDAAGVDSIMGEVEKALAEGAEKTHDLLFAAKLSAMEKFAVDTLENIKSQEPGFEVKQGNAEEIFGVYFAEALTHAQERSSTRVVGINDTTRNQIRTTVAQGIEEGQDIRTISRGIEALYLSQIIPNRSRVIARTEVHESSEAGAYYAARGTELPLEKVWVSTMDDRTREDHASANGQRVGMEDPFNIGGEQLRWPGDSGLGASAGNTINCRCSHSYQRADLAALDNDEEIQEVAARIGAASASLSSEADKSLPDLLDFAALDSILQLDDSTAKILVVPGRLPTGHLGALTHASGYGPLFITVDKNQMTHLLPSVFAHEFGHYMDLLLGGRLVFASSGHQYFPEMDRLMKTIRGTSQYQTISDVASLPSLGINYEMAKYAIDPKELFARAFAQWAALRSGSSKLQKAFNAERKMNENSNNILFAAFHWDARAFRKIASDMDAVFRAKGMLP